MSTANHLAIHLKTLRISANLSQEKLAARAGISPRYYQKIERGMSTPSIDMIFKIAQALKADYTDILDPVWEDYKKPQSDLP